jgi:hypothetical protein
MAKSKNKLPKKNAQKINAKEFKPIIMEDSITKFFELGVQKVLLKVYKNGIIEEIETNYLKFIINENGYSEFHVHFWHSEYWEYRTDVFILETFNDEFTDLADFSIEHIDGDLLNNDLRNLKIRNRWAEFIIEPPFKHIKNKGDVNIENSTQLFDNSKNYFLKKLDIKLSIDSYIKLKEPYVILKEYPYLAIYSSGKVVNLLNNTKGQVNSKGYSEITYKGNKLLCHQLVATAFIKNPNNYKIVNHIDSNKSNNDVFNLEWVNNSLNMLHWKLDQKIAITSIQYKEFVLSRILLEKEMDLEFWLFSNRDPFKIILINEFNNDFFIEIKTENEGLDKFNIMPFLNNPVFNKYSKEERQLLLDKLFERHQFPLNKNDHIIELLKEIGVDFIDYFNWLFDDLKVFADDEVGFIYFEEFKNYCSLIKGGKDGILINDILKLNTEQLDYYQRRGVRSTERGRLIEFFAHHAMGNTHVQKEKNRLYSVALYVHFNSLYNEHNFGYRDHKI